MVAVSINQRDPRPQIVEAWTRLGFPLVEVLVPQSHPEETTVEGPVDVTVESTEVLGSPYTPGPKTGLAVFPFSE